MVFFKRKTVTIPDPSKIPEDINQEVFYIPQTNEYFCTYDEYLDRLDFYLQKKFICELSGTSCLTYFDALRKEEREKETVLKYFPESLKVPILKMVQFNLTTRLDQLVDEIYLRLKDHFFLNEEVVVRYEDERIKAKVVKVDEKRGLYQVDDGKRVLEGGRSQLQRDKKLVSKPALRAFIRNSAYRENWPGSPWTLKSDVCVKYNISQEVPKEILIMKQESERLPQNTHHSQATTSNSHSNLPFNITNVNQLTGSKSSVLKQLGVEYVEQRNIALRELKAKIPLELRQDDLFLIADCSSSIREEILERTRNMPWPQWHKDERIAQLDSFGKTKHLFEVWMFSHFFSEMLDFTENIQKFDDFLTGLLASKVSDEIGKLHMCLLSFLVLENESKLAISLPEEGNESDEDEEDMDEDEDEEEEHEEESEEDDKEHLSNSDDGDEHEGPPKKKHKSEQIPFVVRIGKRDFENGGWQQVLVEILRKIAQNGTEWRSESAEVLKNFNFDENSEITDSEAVLGYEKLNLVERVHCLTLLTRLLYGSDDMREFMDSQYETASKLRRQAHIKELKTHKDELKNAQKLHNMISEQKEGIFSPQVLSLLSEFDLNEHSTLEDIENVIKNISEKVEETTKIVAETNKTLARLDNQRMRLLGKDKFFNRYWWMDSNGVDQSGEKYMGRLWVQGPSETDMEFLKSDEFARHFLEYRSSVVTETTYLKEEANRRLNEYAGPNKDSSKTTGTRQRRKCLTGMQSPKIVTPGTPSGSTSAAPPSAQTPAQTPSQQPIINTNTNYKTGQLKFINQVSRVPAYYRKPEVISKGNRVLSELHNVERKLKVLIQSSRHNGHMLSTDEAVDLRQIESELIEMRRNYGESAQDTIYRLMQLFVIYFTSNSLSNEIKEIEKMGSRPTPGDVLISTSIVRDDISEHYSIMIPPPSSSQANTTMSVPTSAASDDPVITNTANVGNAQAMTAQQQQQYYNPYGGYYQQPTTPVDPSQQVQWVVQQTAQGPMMFPIPIQQYQLMMQQYNLAAAAATTTGDTGDAYNAYIQQVNMQNALIAQQMQYQNYYQQQYGAALYQAPQVAQVPQVAPPQAAAAAPVPQTVPPVATEPQVSAPDAPAQPVKLEENSKEGAQIDTPRTEDGAPEAPAPVAPAPVEPETTNAETTNAETTNAETTNAETTNAATTNAETTNAETTNAETTNAATTNAETNAETTEQKTGPEQSEKSAGVTSTSAHDSNVVPPVVAPETPATTDAPPAPPAAVSNTAETPSTATQTQEQLPQSTPASIEAPTSELAEPVPPPASMPSSVPASAYAPAHTPAHVPAQEPAHTIPAVVKPPRPLKFIKHQLIKPRPSSPLQVKDEPTTTPIAHEPQTPIKHEIEDEEKMTPMDIMNELQPSNGMLEFTEWRYYESPEELDQLLSYISEGGKRENKLSTAIRKIQFEMKSLMKTRLSEIKNDETTKE